tara:strand:+ start:2339 stop:3004 length:666 start_codon:yes stop_codon:yes gene_type:complete
MPTYLVTGANRGIGLEYCKQLSQRGDDVIATCRASSLELDSLGIQVECDIELCSTDAVAKLVEKLEGVNIDVLIHNAGIAENNSLLNIDKESVMRQFETNALSPLLFVKALLKNMSRGSKVVLMSSRMGSIEDNTSGGSYGYRMSKVALCMTGKSLSIDLKPMGISVGILHPGLVSTRMTGFTSSGITAQQSVVGLLKRIDSLEIDNTGSFWHSNGDILPW